MTTAFNDITLPEFEPHARSAPEPTVRTTLQAGAASAQMNLGALLASSSNLSRQQNDDLHNSLLFAQLAADKKCDRVTASVEWQTLFLSTLAVIGWELTKSQTSTQDVPSTVNWCTEVCSLLPTDQQALATAAVKGCQKQSADSKAIVLWENTAVSRCDGLLMVGTASDVKDSLTLSLVIISFTSKAECAGFMTWTAGWTLLVQSVSLELNEDIYGKVRKAIIDKLGNRPDYMEVAVPLA